MGRNWYSFYWRRLKSIWTKKKINGVVELPEVKGRTTPTKSTIPIQHKVRQPSHVYFKTRDEARVYAKQQASFVTDMGKGNQQGRWCVII